MVLKGVEIGVRQTNVSILQYADDTLFFCKVDTPKCFDLKTILKCFELAYGLKVNYSKSKVGGVGVSANQIMGFATILNCGTMTTLFTYLGGAVGGNHKRRAF